MYTFCTIITADYFPRALALYTSIAEFDSSMEFQVLIADDKPVAAISENLPNLKIRVLKELQKFPLLEELYNKYAHINIDNFRWSMKPVFASWLLEKGYTKVLYVDCDMFFVNDYNFLFTELDSHSFLLTPHWKTTNPLVDEQSFLSTFTSGIFLAGFFGANKNGLPALRWWANACHFKMMPAIELGVHDDQRYLDAIPVFFEKTKIIRHRGCNIGAFNYEESVRTIVDGQVMINGVYPVIFIHFDDMMVSGILKGHDKLLLPYLQQYEAAYKKNGHDLNFYIKKLEPLKNAGLLKRIKWNLKIRTRIKRFFYKLAQSL
jgi:hypothetical protein